MGVVGLTRSLPDVSVNVITLIFRAYLVDQSMEHLSATLKRGGIKDLLAFFPPNKRTAKSLEEHFKTEGLPQVAEWWAKKQYAVVKESLVKELTELCEREEPTEQVISNNRTLFPKLTNSCPRLLLLYRPAKTSHPFLRSSWFIAYGRDSWPPSTGAHVQIKLKILLSAKSE